MMRGRRVIALIAMAVLAFGQLTGCGFHLRGAMELPEVMQRTYLQGVSVDSALAQEVRAVIEGAGGELVTRLADATAILRLGGDRSGRSIASVDSDGKVREYALRYSLTYTLLNSAGEVLLPSRTLETSRIYTFDQGNVLGSGTEEAVLIREMRSSAVAQMMRQVEVAAREGLRPTKDAEAGADAGEEPTAEPDIVDEAL